MVKLISSYFNLDELGNVPIIRFILLNEHTPPSSLISDSNITSTIWIVDSQQMPHSISPPQGMCVIASGYSIFLSGLTLERLQKDSLWEKTLGQALPKVSDIMHVITPYSSSAIKNFIGHFFSYHSYYLSCYFQISFCSFLKSMLMVI